MSKAGDASGASEARPRKDKSHYKKKAVDPAEAEAYLAAAAAWKDEVSPDKPLSAPIEESSFATLFPKYREQYLREVWPLVTQTLKHYGIACELNLIEGSMSVKTTRKMWDPFALFKSRDLIKLLSRSIPVHQALKIMQPDMMCDIIKIKNLVRNKERFAKRRLRLIGPNGCTLKALELVTDCYIMVQGNTVSCMGSYNNLKILRRIVLDCMQNIHPIYRIKELMIRRELSKDPELAKENWDRFLPKFKKSHSKKKKTVKHVKKERSATPFPPAQQPRKVDLEMESGEFWLKKKSPSAEEEEAAEKARASEAKKAAKKAEKEAQYIAPEEASHRSRARADPTGGATAAAAGGAIAQLPTVSREAERQARKEEKRAAAEAKAAAAEAAAAAKKDKKDKKEKKEKRSAEPEPAVEAAPAPAPKKARAAAPAAGADATVDVDALKAKLALKQSKSAHGNARDFLA